MVKVGLTELFIEELEDTHNAVSQIIGSLPVLINAASYPELKEALSKTLEEQEEQLRRIEHIFELLEFTRSEKTSEAMQGLLYETEEFIANKTPSPTIDSAIISALQKVEHFQIACYGTLKSFAKHLSMDKEIVNMLQTSLDEVSAADKKLTNIADGSFFTPGINQEAVQEGKTNKEE